MIEWASFETAINTTQIYQHLELARQVLRGITMTKEEVFSALDEVFQDEFERCNPKYCMLDQRLIYARNILASH